MVVKSKGIVLGYMKYRDTSIIVRIFTEEYGYGSYVVNSIRSQRSKKSIGHFQPFSILDLVLYIKETRDLQRISEFKSHIVLRSIHQDLLKSTITMFLGEVFSKLLQAEQSPNPSLYAFAEASIHTFDQIKEGVSNFHIQFLLKLAAYLGFEIEQADHLFSTIDKLLPTAEGHHILEQMLQEPYGQTFDLNGTIRREMVDAILAFYEHHAQISKPKSIEVLRSILG